MPSDANPSSEIEASAPRHWRDLALFVLTGTGVILCLVFVHALFFAVVGAITLAVVLDFPNSWLRRRFSSSVAALLLLLALGAAIILPGVFAVRSVVGEAFALARFVQTGAADRDAQRILHQHPKLNQATDKLRSFAPEDLERETASRAAMLLGRGLQSTARGVVSLVLMLFLLFFLLRDRDEARAALASIVPLSAAYTDDLLKRLGDLIYAVFAGRFVIAGLQGLLAGLAYVLLGVPGALLWGVITGAACLIPAFGAFLVWVPVALYLGLAQGWVKALILALWGGVVISNLDNVLYPMLVGKRTNLHTAVIFVAVLGGIGLFGITGLVLGPVIAAATMLLLASWRKRLHPELPSDSLTAKQQP